MKNTITILIVLIFACNQVKSQTYSQTFENVTTNQLLDSGWVFSGVDIGNSNKLSGIKELVTQLLNVYTTGNTFVTTAYYNGKGTNTVQFQHVINNASGKDIDLVIDALDSANNVISSYSYTYNNASVVNSNFSFAKAGRFKLKLSWSGAKVRSGSTAGLDMLLVNRPLAPIDLVSLPVTLNHFKAINKDCNNEISWSTASEENLSKFEVTRSIDGKNFTTVGSVNAIGNSNEINVYNFSDENVSNIKATTVFYQLRMVDENGDYRFSNIAQVKLNNVISTVSVYPNPTLDYLNISLTETVEVESFISIMDANGKAVALTTPSYINGSSIQFDIRQLENGIYFVKILNNDGSLTSAKFIKR